MTLDLLGHVPQLTTKNKKTLDHRRSQTTPSPSSQHEIYRKLSLRKLEKVKIKKKKNKEKSYYHGRIREVFEERGKL